MKFKFSLCIFLSLGLFVGYELLEESLCSQAEADAGLEAECPSGRVPVVMLRRAQLEVVEPIAGQGVGSDPMPAQPSRGPGPYGPELDTQAEAEVATLDAVVRGEAEAGRGQPP